MFQKNYPPRKDTYGFNDCGILWIFGDSSSEPKSFCLTLRHRPFRERRENGISVDVEIFRAPTSRNRFDRHQFPIVKKKDGIGHRGGKSGIPNSESAVILLTLEMRWPKFPDPREDIGIIPAQRPEGVGGGKRAPPPKFLYMDIGRLKEADCDGIWK